MKCGIVTFGFVHNYGAVLQADSLKTYLLKIGQDPYVINYEPRRMIKYYSLNPLADGMHPKAIVRRFLTIPKKILQVRLFMSFIKRRLCDDKVNDSEDAFIQQMTCLDAVFCGSDQIWNDDITGETTIYYAADNCVNTRRIAYAASFGKDNLSEFQKKCVRKILPSFYSVSVREKSAKENIDSLVNIKSKVVLDPVFLNDRNYWERLALKTKMKIKERYVLYYSLKDRANELAEHAERKARELQCKLIVIHPTGKHQKIKGKQLYNVGPYEFLWLIEHAEHICTSSFHAFAFSVIFRKCVTHIRCAETDSRVSSFVELIEAERCIVEQRGKVATYEMQKLKTEKLNELIIEAQNFIITSLE